MPREDSIMQSLNNKFTFLEGKIVVRRERRIFVEVPREEFLKVIRFVSYNLKFDQCCMITGLDLGDELQFIYHLANDQGIVLNLRQNVSKEDPVIKSVGSIYENVDLYERELEDMLGAKVEGLPSGEHYPLPENWPEGQYPLRKDWKPDQIEQSKEG